MLGVSHFQIGQFKSEIQIIKSKIQIYENRFVLHNIYISEYV